MLMFHIGKFFTVLLSAALVSAACFISLPSGKAVLTSADTEAAVQIILDAGHGGFDGGALAADGTVEKDINLNICLYLSAILRENGYGVIMTRESDVSTDDVETDKIAVRKKSDLKNRLELMSDYPEAVFISVHLNKFTTSAASGSQVFYSGRDEKSEILGDCIQSRIVEMLQPENTRVNKQATSSTYLLYNATVPAVLVECGFLSNSAELERLKDEEYQRKTAFCIFCGINDYFSSRLQSDCIA